MINAALGLAAVALSVFGLLPYLYDSWKGRTRPHVLTWLIWTTMTFIAFGAQVVGGGGPGAWTTGVTAMLCLPILAIAARSGRATVRPSDWFSLGGALFAGVLWALTDDPTWSVVLVTLIDVIAFAPTIRKSYSAPHEETLLNYVTSMVKHGFSIAAMSTLSVTTVFYPAVVGAMNLVMVSVLVGRRKALLAG